MKVFDNVNDIVKDDLKLEINKSSRLSIAAACFSIYAYQELKSQLEEVYELRFIFTSPTFVKEKVAKEKREFYIPRLSREKSLYGNEFEVKLRNELSQKAIARECAEWIKKKVIFKSNTTEERMPSFINVESNKTSVSYSPINEFTTVELGCERGNNAFSLVNKLEAPHSDQYLRMFETIWNDKNKLQDVTDIVIDSITAAYKENSAELVYFIALYNIFKGFLENTSEDVLPNEATGFKNSAIWSMLYDFQKDAVLAIINKLERYNGCILADSVGLGKTFTALAVIKYYENRNKSVLVLCPKKLNDNWRMFRENYKNNPIAQDRLRYDVLYHTDLSRKNGTSGNIDLEKLNWENYDLVVIDESHNFRNGGEVYGDDEYDNRYNILLKKVIRAGVKTRVLMLSATPVNNRFTDLRNQLALAYEGTPALINDKLNTSKPIDEIFRNAQTAFNRWSKLEQSQRTTDALLNSLDLDFFEVLDSVTIARSRKHIEKYYKLEEIGKFPDRMRPISLRPDLTDIDNAINYNEIYTALMNLNLAVYTPTEFLHESAKDKYIEKDVNINRAGRERGIHRLMRTNLLKRLESSVHAFRLTLQRIKELIAETIKEVNMYNKARSAYNIRTPEYFTLDGDDDNQYTLKEEVKIDLGDMDYLSWRTALKADFDILNKLINLTEVITPPHDKKLQTLLQLIADKIEHPFNENNKKILIFSAFSDTAEYLYGTVSEFVKKRFKLETAMVTGSVDGKTTIPKFKPTLNNVLTCFSPISKDKELLMPDDKSEITVLIGTDCISEGQNLQDCDYVVNYDIHWNPVRIIQRFGRIDRIGSKNEAIQLVNFWPNVTLDEYINLKNRVETRMKISVMTATGDDDLVNVEEKGDLEYRKAQLERLQNEIVDIEEMQSGVSIMDLGLNEFRLDLMEYMRANPDIEHAPFGMHAVAERQDTQSGVIFVLKNINNAVNINMQNRLHPYYLVYIGENGELVHSHLSPKKMLDTMRYLCRGKDKPIETLCAAFNKETKDGRNMRKYSTLLSTAIDKMVKNQTDSDIDSLFKPGGTSAKQADIHGLEDFELICFIVVK